MLKLRTPPLLEILVWTGKSHILNRKNGELQTQMTYEMYDSASDCTGTQPPGFPTTFLSNECVEGSPGAGVYYFVDCSDGMSAQPGWMSFALLSISLVTMMYK